MDCVRVNHCQLVKETFENSFIRLYDSAGYPHEVSRGYPPYRPKLSILDGQMFSSYQHDISSVMKDLPSHETDTDEVLLYKEIPKLWKSKKYTDKAATAFRKYPSIIKKYIDNQGFNLDYDPTL